MFERTRRNRASWLALFGGFAVGLIATSVAAVSFGGDVEFLPEAIALSSISAAVFGICSAGVLFRHRAIAARSVATAGAVSGVSTYALTWALWLATPTSFRHAVPFELIPVFVAALFGLIGGATLYLASLE